jgi:hypothetical protein
MLDKQKYFYDTFGRERRGLQRRYCDDKFPVGGESFVFYLKRSDRVLGPHSLLSNGYRRICFAFEAAGVQNYLSRPSSSKLRISGYVATPTHTFMTCPNN